MNYLSVPLMNELSVCPTDELSVCPTDEVSVPLMNRLPSMNCLSVPLMNYLLAYIQTHTADIHDHVLGHVNVLACRHWLLPVYHRPVVCIQLCLLLIV